MRERRTPNVEALAAILVAYFKHTGLWDLYECPEELEVAQWLAARGVLAVDALTDEQATAFPFDGEFLSGDPKAANDRRAALRRLATGEAE